ncbi:S8 family peptidase [Bradyrhizobium sp. 170]|uniref:S8 family peptidase n=1 Tax=Bradyrhizobium sp. 170 TaxID=2782641 RepID=UPI001FFEF346|nr:S8 family peptidase [Bradyrhizobium sp. 170]UPK03823.1 S8 family peptidase [Bradyrhizobium sp. 170]
MPTYDHLPLKRLEGVLERRVHGFGLAPSREAKQHGARIQTEIEQVVSSYGDLPAIDGIDPSLILKVSVAGNIDEDEWRKIGLTVLSVDGDKSVVLFADDKSLQDFRNKVEAYQGELPLGQKAPPFAGLIAAIESVALLNASDRIGPDLRAAGFADPNDFLDTETYLLDVELFFPPKKEEAEIFIYRLKQAIASRGAILSAYTGYQIIIARIECTGAAVRAALALPEVAVADMPPQPDVISESFTEIDVGDLTVGNPPAEDAIVIGIIDSGVNFGHPLLANTEAGTISIDPAWSVSDVVGHGTSVASIAAFGDIAARVSAKNFDAQFWIASARVLDDLGQFPKQTSVPALMETAIKTLHASYGCRIFNISLGNPKKTYNGGKPEPWAATLDALARELDVLIIVSAGNREDLTNSFHDGIVTAYPQYLLSAASRIIDPATAAIALSVGAIAQGNGLEDADEELAGVRPICSTDEPSPFTRSGPGVRGMIKPDLVDFGGNAVWDGPTGTLVNGNQKEAAGIWTMHHKPVEKLFRSRSGTSFAAPNIAYKAGLLLTHFPSASANLLRSLLVLSANIPRAVAIRPRGLNEKVAPMVCGYGVADPESAALSDDGRVVLFAEDELALDHFAVFEVPIPSEFQTEKGTREIKVALAFDPPVRHTRADYLGVTMGWRLVRGTDEEDVFDRYRKWTKEEGKPPEFPPRLICPTDIGPDLRESGTLQVGTYTGKRDISRYGDKYYIAVWCARRWAPPGIEKQRYALSVQLRHENVTTLYQSLTQPVTLRT